MIERAKIVQTSGKHAKSRRIFAALARVPLVLAPRNVGAPLVTPADGTVRPNRHPHPQRSHIIPPASRATFMSPLRLAERRHPENVGAPLVTPGKPPATLTRTTRNAAAASCHDGSGLHKWNPCGHRREMADRIYGMADRYFWMADRNGGTAGRENGRPLCRGRRGVGLMSWLSCV